MNKEPMTLGSLFDGSGGFPLGGVLCGITPIFASEVEPFSIRVTSKRFPQMKHLGDISTIHGAEIDPVDIITFGSLCQDMSVAGKRSGLDGSRSCLFYEAIRIVKEMRCKTNGQKPRYIVWENVPGAFSSNSGDDFKAVLEAVASVKGDYAVPCPPKGKWTGAGEILGDDFSIAWRCVDAQFWGVPQRRRRIYLVADFNGGCAGKILFESEGLFRNLEASVCPWKRTAGTSEEGASATGIALNDQGGNRMDVTEGYTSTLRAEAHHPPCVMESAGFCTEHSAGSRGIGYEEEKAPTLRAGVVPATVYENHSQDCRYTGPLDVAQTVLSTFGTGGNNQPFVVETPKTLKIRSGCEGGGKGALIQDNLSATLSCNNDQTLFVPKAYGICSKDSNSMKSANPHSGFYTADTSRTLDGNGGNPSCNQGGIAIVEGNGSRPSHHGNGYAESEVMYTLNTVDKHAMAYGIDRAAFNHGRNAQYGFAVEEETQPTMVAKGPGAVAAPTFSSSKASFFTSAEEELANTLVATDYKDPPLVNDTDDDLEYIVRRLTPTECARLQGFPDGGAMTLTPKCLPKRNLPVGRISLKPIVRLWVLPVSRRPKSKSSSGCRTPIPTLPSTRCGATAWLV